MSDEKAEAFNLYTANWISRIDSMNNSIILISGGVMSITIGAFLSSTPPTLEACASLLIRFAWVSLALSLACSIMLKFALVISGAIVLKNWKQKINVEQDGRIIIDSPKWFRMLSWVFGSVSVISCVVGFSLISYGAGSLLKMP